MIPCPRKNSGAAEDSRAGAIDNRKIRGEDRDARGRIVAIGRKVVAIENSMVSSNLKVP
jgi:hypothetical protein